MSQSIKTLNNLNPQDVEQLYWASLLEVGRWGRRHSIRASSSRSDIFQAPNMDPGFYVVNFFCMYPVDRHEYLV